MNGDLEKTLASLDAETTAHPLFRNRCSSAPRSLTVPELEVDLLSKLVMACGDVSLVQFEKSLITHPLGDRGGYNNCDRPGPTGVDLKTDTMVFQTNYTQCFKGSAHT